MPGPRRAGQHGNGQADVRPAPRPDRLPARPDGRSGSSAHDEIPGRADHREPAGRRRRRDPGARGGGHRTTRCFDEANAVGFPCQAVVDPADAHCSTRRTSPWWCASIAPHPRPLEQGAAALQAGIPVVEAGPDCWTPTGLADGPAGRRRRRRLRGGGRLGLAELRGGSCALVDPTFAAAGVARDDVTCTIDTSGLDLNVRTALPVPVTTGVRQALAVRVLDAVPVPATPTARSGCRSACRPERSGPSAAVRPRDKGTFGSAAWARPYVRHRRIGRSWQREVTR